MNDRSSRLVLRDRLLTELVEPSAASAPSASLLAATDDEAELILAGGERCWLLTAPLDPDALRQRASEIIGAHRRAPLLLIVAGGGSGFAKALKSAIPFFQLSGRIIAYQFDDDGRLRKVSGRKSQALLMAARSLRDRLASLHGERVLNREQLDGWIRAAQADAEQESRFVASLRSRFPVVTAAIGLICVAFYGLTLYWGGGHFPSALWHLGAIDHERIIQGEWWRLLSAAFLHGSFMHLFVNMLALASFGVFLERLLGPHRFLVLYTVSGIVGSLASALMRRGGIAVGASGAIWGLMAAGAGLAWKPRGLLPPMTLDVFKRQAITPVAVNFLYSFQKGIDFIAHFGGGAAGFALMATGVLTRGLRPEFAQDRAGEPIVPAPAQTWRVMSAACAVACLGSLAVSIAMLRPWELDHPKRTRHVLEPSEVSIELPSSMDAGPPQASGTWTIFHCGSMPRAPLTVEIRLHDISGPPDVQEAFKVFQDKMRKPPMESATIVGAPRIEEIAGRKFAAADYQIAGRSVVRTLATVAGHHVVILHFEGLEGGEFWDRTTHEIATSVRSPD